MEKRPLSPRDIVTQKFGKAMWGYSQTDVVKFLEDVSKQYEDALRAISDQQRIIKALEAEIESWKEREKELSLLRESALKETELIREQAMQEAQKHFQEVEKAASEIRSNTERWLEEVIQQIEQAEQQRNSFETAFRSALDSHYAILKRESPAEPLSQKLQNFLRSGSKSDISSRDI